MITSPQVLVIGAEGEKMGVVDTDTALAMAEASSNIKNRKRPARRASVKKPLMSKKSKCAPISTLMIMR
jgi:translation initiation factor IF-3